jgi:hypothetical protein
VSAIAEVKALRRGIDMMKMESLLTSAVTANHATTASLLNKCPLDDPAPLRHGLGPAAHAPVVATTLEDELGTPVTSARQLGALRPPRRNLASSSLRF